MATEQNPNLTNSFNKGLSKDPNDTFQGEGVWTHARNAVNNAHDGELGVLGNEPANLHCVTLPYTLIGAIALGDEEWAVFTTNDVDSEIGIFNEGTCTYRKVVNAPCLNFKRTHPITGASRKKYDCGRPVYWADGLNPDRYLDLDNVPLRCFPKDPVQTNTPPPVMDVYKYTVQSTVVPEAVLKGSIQLSCTDNGCTVQGEVRVHLTFEEVLSEPLTIHLGVITRNANNENRGVGFSFYPLPPGTDPWFFYNKPERPFVVNVPAGVSSYSSGSIQIQDPRFSEDYTDVWDRSKLICHNCQFPVTEAYIKSATPGIKLNLSSAGSYTVHNMDVLGGSPTETISFTYNDTNGASVGPVSLSPGEAKTVCAKEGSVVVSIPGKASVTQGESCIKVVPVPEPDNSGCREMICTDELDCEKIRLAPVMTAPCLSLKKGTGSGNLPNGSYQVVLAYTVNGIRVTDYFLPSNVQSLFSHGNLSGALEVTIGQIDTEHFDEFELVVISYVNSQTVAKKLGVYSTHQKTVYIDSIDPALPTVGLNLIPLRTPAYEKSDAMYRVNNYLLRSGIYSKFAFNYQQQANSIRAKWVAVKYPSDYYRKGGHNASYLRDEQYAFFIRWVYNTGEKSASFHIPGRPAFGGDRDSMLGPDAFEVQSGQRRERWQVENTSHITSFSEVPLPDGGVQIAEGEMGYWQSTELYPDNKPEVWGTLCGEHIRHHKFPDNTIHEALNHFTDEGKSIVVMGVKFEGITHPLDNRGNPILDIVGYEILRGSREGHKSIVAKGMLNNMREYNVEGTDTIKGLYANYPYNDLRPDYYLTSDRSLIDKGPADGSDSSRHPLTGYRKDMFSFHSPETTFSRPYLSASELKVYGELSGESKGMFEAPYKHPKHKMLTKFTDLASKILGAIASVGSIIRIAGGAPDLVLKGDKDIPIDINLIIPQRDNFAVGGGGTVLGTGGQAMVPNPAIVATNAVIAVYNGIMAIALLPIQTAVISEQLMNIVYGLAAKRQFALQYNSHGFYTQYTAAAEGERRRSIQDASYVGSNLQSFSTDYRINNLHRPDYVVLQLSADLQDPYVVDDSRNRIKGDSHDTEPNRTVTTRISSKYGALKVNLPSQYGQLENIKQVPIGSCVFATRPDKTVTFATPVLFGGDTYINRFTEKNTFLFFTDWLLGQPDEYEYDYRGYINVPYPRYWIDTERGNYSLFSGNTTVKRHLNARESSTFYVKKGYFYLSCNGVRDFFVESEINLAQRDWDDEVSKRHYDPYGYTDIQAMFRSDVIKANNYYKYDYSLSVSRLYQNYFSWGEVLPRDYDPEVAESCYTYNPERVIYSLPQDQELKKDNWRVYLVNNYKDFTSRVSAVKAVNKTGALILFESESPVQFMGVDQLQTDAGTKITIGDGGLFQQPLQQIVNADGAYQYGSCQNKWSVVGTPHGIFWVSQEQGKIFQFAGGASDISRIGNKWWFSQYLPSRLREAFPDFDLYDNPIVGTGVQAVYDNVNEMVYFCKKDYRPLRDDLLYDKDQKAFYFLESGNRVTVSLQDEQYFEEVSWTASFDPKNNMWISLHDWHPSFVIPSKTHFLTTEDQSLWRHNMRCDLYTNYYGRDYPFEVEFVAPTGQQVTTVRNIEYVLECYRYDQNCRDRHHILDENFDQAMVFNSEQNSGVLNLKLKGKNNPLELLEYPKVGANSIDIHCSKEENKYRFNQFWDIIRDRGEFTDSRVSMFVTNEDGYTRYINPQAVRYSKEALEHKKFRHYANRVFLRRVKSGATKMTLKLNNVKIQPSFR